MSVCNRITKPKFTKEQVAECKKCKHVSGKKIWCCLFGCWLDGRSETLVPKRSILRPPQIPQILTLERMKADYEQAKILRRKSPGMGEIITENEYIRRRMICKECNGGFKCLHTCCGLPTKAAQSIWKCKSNKW